MKEFASFAFSIILVACAGASQEPPAVPTESSASREAAPEKAAPQEAEPQEAAPQELEPQEGVAQENAPPPGARGMTRPSWVVPPEVTYTRKAVEAHAEGTVLVRCVLNTDGSISPCQIVKGLPYMDEAVLDAMSRARMTPVMRDGKPIRVRLVLPLRLRVPPPRVHKREEG